MSWRHVDIYCNSLRFTVRKLSISENIVDHIGILQILKNKDVHNWKDLLITNDLYIKSIRCQKDRPKSTDLFDSLKIQYQGACHTTNYLAILTKDTFMAQQSTVCCICDHSIHLIVQYWLKHPIKSLHPNGQKTTEKMHIGRVFCCV